MPFRPRFPGLQLSWLEFMVSDQSCAEPDYRSGLKQQWFRGHLSKTTSVQEDFVHTVNMIRKVLALHLIIVFFT